MGVVAVSTSLWLGEGLNDPDGSLGPSWFRLPAMLLGAFVVDVVPRAVWRSRGRPHAFGEHARRIVLEHWTRDRVGLVVVGLVSFYVTYVSYRNLKNFLPRVTDALYDKQLHAIDKALMFGHEPAVLLHHLLGETFSAHVLAFVYLLFLPISPLSLVIYLVWSRRISVGYWYATAQCLAWLMGTISYYLLPTLGPNFVYVWLYSDLDQTSVAAMQKSLYYSRGDVRWNPLHTESIQSVAGFASLHVGIILTLALITHYTVRHALIRRDRVRGGVARCACHRPEARPAGPGRASGRRARRGPGDPAGRPVVGGGLPGPSRTSSVAGMVGSPCLAYCRCQQEARSGGISEAGRLPTVRTAARLPNRREGSPAAADVARS
jgi:hypothetical protein